jgi:hypothetical protein
MTLTSPGGRGFRRRQTAEQRHRIVFTNLATSVDLHGPEGQVQNLTVRPARRRKVLAGCSRRKYQAHHDYRGKGANELSSASDNDALRGGVGARRRHVLLFRKRSSGSLPTAFLTGEGDFLERFHSYGWYLDDLVLAPVNQLTPRERKAAHLGAAQDLQRRIAEYRPLAIVCLLKSIGTIVRAAASGAGFDGPFYEVPFPGNGQQRRFHLQMIDIIPELPRGSHSP